VARFFGQLRISPQRHDGLDRQIGVMGQMTGEVVGREPILGIEPLLLRIRRLFGEQRPLPSGFHRHLILLRRLPAPVHLPIGVWIASQIVRRERKTPARQLRIPKHRRKRRCEQLRIQKKKQRRAGIENIHRIDATVRRILPGEEEETFRPRPRPVHAQWIADGERSHKSETLSAGLAQIGPQCAVEILGAMRREMEVALALCEKIGDGCPIAPPVRAHPPFQKRSATEYAAKRALHPPFPSAGPWRGRAVRHSQDRSRCGFVVREVSGGRELGARRRQTARNLARRCFDAGRILR
jgi:hypothetical protein